MSIERIGTVGDLERLSGLSSGLGGVGPIAPPPAGPEEARFGAVLEQALHSAAEAGQTADQQTQALARGTIDDIHGTMITAKEAEISLKLVGTIRNKLIDAFHELWRTSV